MTEAAETSDTSCSTERPPKITPTRIRFGLSNSCFVCGILRLVICHVLPACENALFNLFVEYDREKRGEVQRSGVASTCAHFILRFGGKVIRFSPIMLYGTIHSMTSF